MEILVWIGAAISLVGVVGLMACVVMAMKAKRAGLDEDALRARLKTVVTYNFGALMVSALGLVMVIVGITLA